MKKNTAVSKFIKAAMLGAAAMLDNASFILSELKNVRMRKPHRAKAETICLSLIETRRDVVTECSTLRDLVASNAAPSAILRVSERIGRWFRQDTNSLHKLVMSLLAERAKDRDIACAYVLVAESATNILKAVNPALVAIEALRREAGKTPGK